MIISKFEAINNLVGGGISGRADGTEINYRGKTPPTDEEIETAWAEMQADWTAQKYARNRKLNYPDIGDQLDALYHAGVFPANMAAKIKETKDKYPKG